jgi:hypothetical protein
MMKGDFSRRTFRSEHHYHQVLMQQGRVQLDADWNEQVDIARYLAGLTAADTIGSHGGPRHAAGMAIVCPGSDHGGSCPGDKVTVSAGRYYVDGILCENEQDVGLAEQPDLPGVDLPDKAGTYVAYLDVWNQHVSAVDQPSLLEVALQGPDTTTRSRTVWQVRLARTGAKGCGDLVGWLPPYPQSSGRMRARAQSTPQDQRACIVPVTAGYRRLENQLYRVEVHDASDNLGGGGTFVWSRENGSVVVRLDTLEGDVLTVASPGRDDRLGFVKDGWVEVLPRERALRGEPGFLARLDTPDGVRLKVAEWRDGSPPSDTDLGDNAVVRRWESKAAVPVPEKGEWLDLEDGVQVAFEPQGVLHTGDYWLVPARTANLRDEDTPSDVVGDVQWERKNGEPVFLPAEGIVHHYAPIALLVRGDDGTWRPTDCRHLFGPLTELGGDRTLSLVGGEGQEAMPGDPLPLPLEVQVSQDGIPESGAIVQFTASAGTVAPDLSQLPSAGSAGIDIPTGGDGIARCAWLLDVDPRRTGQSVTARLLDAAGAPAGAPIDFSGNLSVAEQVWYDAGDCPTMTGVHTVQQAIDRLKTVRSLALLSGDGQFGAPDSDLALPVELMVRTMCGPVPDATVHCRVAEGSVAATADGLPNGDATVDLRSDSEGKVQCFWHLGATRGTEVLTATLLQDVAPSEPPTELTVTATAGQDPARRSVALRVVLLGQEPRPLSRAERVTQEELVEGMAVLLDRAGEVPTAEDPLLRFTVELPFPLSAADVRLWGSPVVGTTPVVLAGDVSLIQVGADQAVSWTPTDASRAFLSQVLSHAGRQVDRVRCSLAVSDLLLATGTAPFTVDRTFPLWLAATLNDLMVVPTRAGAFRTKSAQSATQLALSRDRLRERLPERVAAWPEAHELDPKAARTAIDRAFGNQPGQRRIVLLTEERFRSVAELLTETFAQLEVTVEIMVADDVVAEARERTEAQQPLDGVLTDRAGSESVEALTGFLAAVTV